ncbi:MAG: NADH-quinone oxidoreductase subunit NuoH [Gemmatales bacterium]|nr:NADH-quinone oxidoreductase subunit NuoH [Gemmatales bacterium]MDW7994315.1 NADH-quinone oxidoreductase subunit NuoH [Gemmatales bacterium]
MDWLTIGLIIFVISWLQILCAYLIYLERKVAAWVQDRKGPNRVGPWGLFQPIADGLKFLFKEQVVPAHVHRFLYILAPSIAVITTMLAFAVVPFGPTDVPDPRQKRFIIAPNLDIGLLFIFAIASLNVYSIILGGWASNNKYSLLGSLRSAAQIISYEIPLALSVLGVIVLVGSLNLEHLLNEQARLGIGGWLIWYQPLGWLLFFASALAESNRLPFDLPEAEQELVGGYHTEYSGMKFAMFFLGEYTHVTTVSLLMVILYFGGWHFPFVAEFNANYPGATGVKVLVLWTKASLVILVIMLLRWTLPRFRFDQLMHLAWMGLVPLSLLNLLSVMIVRHWSLSPWLLLPCSVIILTAIPLLHRWKSRQLDWA